MCLIVFIFYLVVEVGRVVHDATHVTTTVGMIVGMTGEGTIATTTGTTTDHTGDDLHLFCKPADYCYKVIPKLMVFSIILF